MVVGPDYVFVEVPRTASTATRRWLLENAQGRLLPGGHHASVVPKEYLDRYCFATVRNPASRLFSLWCSCTNRGRESFLDFVLKLTNIRKFGRGGSWGIGASWIWRTQASFLRNVRVDTLLRFEDLPNSLAKLHFIGRPVTLPVVHSQISSIRRRELSADEREAVWGHSREDFKLFGYSL